MLWVYGHNIFCNSFSTGIIFRRQILTSKVGLRAERVIVGSPSVTLVQRYSDIGHCLLGGNDGDGCKENDR